MDEFFTYDPLITGCKGLVYIGDAILVYRRDENTNKYPLCLDLPGGGLEDNETPFMTFQREVKEEFGLDIRETDIKYVHRYKSSIYPGKFAYFPVATLPREAEQAIRFGDEGIEYFLLSIEDYLDQDNVAWPLLQERTREYIRTLT